MQYKVTTRLFKGKYQYKIVLICSAAAIFRTYDSEKTLARLEEWSHTVRKIYTNIERLDVNYALALYKQLAILKDIEVRVEQPWITVYSNSLLDVISLASIREENVKYVFEPPKNVLLEKGTVFMPNVNHDFCVTLGNIVGDKSAFVKWAASTSKIKLTKNCQELLLRSHSIGGSYFYVTGENNLLTVRMHLAGCIAKVERIIKA
jgi:hypothetical protein